MRAESCPTRAVSANCGAPVDRGARRPGDGRPSPALDPAIGVALGPGHNISPLGEVEDEWTDMCSIAEAPGTCFGLKGHNFRFFNLTRTHPRSWWVTYLAPSNETNEMLPGFCLQAC